MRGRRHFRGDPRYDLENVSRGFTSRPRKPSDDSRLLERICAAYNSAARDARDAPKAFQATGWWEQVRRERLAPVIQALKTSDIEALGRMYRDFFRDACSAGLIGVPFGLNGAIPDTYRRFYLADALYCIDHWAEQTGRHFDLSSLTGPEIGNPFGVMIDGTLVTTGAPYQHYCAQRILDLVDSEMSTVAEIGGGYGGVAWYLLRDYAGVRYFNFDVPESLALASYYLLKAFPDLNFLLYGEKAVARADVALLPLFELERMPRESVDITFSSHAVSDLSDESMAIYLQTLARFTRGHFLYIGNRRAAESIANLGAQKHSPFRLAETRTSGWHAHTHSDADEMECLYQVGPVHAAAEYAAAGRAV